MSAATCQIQIGTGASVSWSNGEGGITHSRDDALNGTTPVPEPTSAGTDYTWIKNCVLAVTVTGTTNISNRRISIVSSLSTGLYLFWKAVAVASYVQASSSSKPTDNGTTNGATPSGYTLMSTTATVYDNTSVATSSTGPNGSMAVVVCGVDSTYTGGAGSAIALSNIIITYDEA